MMREPEVENRVRAYLQSFGYEVVVRQSRFGPDVIAVKGGQRLLLEIKGDRPGHRSSPATINVDVLTLLGQIVLRIAQEAASEYGIAIRPVHKRLVLQAMPTLRRLGIRVLLVDDEHVSEIATT